MKESILRAARELGIESKVHVTEDHQINPVVSVIEGTHAVNGRIDAGWLMDEQLTRVKAILSQMYQDACKN
jgi:hypothetical protein